MPIARHLPACVAACALAVLSLSAWSFTVDDAFIVARYAGRIVEGEGYTFSGVTPSDGVTGPLWLLPAMLSAALRRSPIGAAKLVSLAGGVAAVALCVARVRVAALGRASAWLAALVCVSSLPLIVWSIGGLETGAATFCITAIALCAVTHERAPAWVPGVLSAAIAWLRPELLGAALFLLGVMGVRDLRRARTMFALAILGIVAVVSFRLALFDHVLPMTASAKPAMLEHGTGYLLRAVSSSRAWLLVVALAYVALKGGTQSRILVVALVVHAGCVSIAGGDWMPGRRLFAPVVPMLAVALALGLRALLVRRPRWVASYAVLLAGASALEVVPELRAVRAAGAQRAVHAPELATPVCHASSPVAAIDIGELGTLCPYQDFVDLGGLTEPAIAYARGAHLDKRIDPAWLRARAPGMVILHSRDEPRVDDDGNLRWFAGYPVERRVLAMPFMRAYRVDRVVAWSPQYFYVLLVPR